MRRILFGIAILTYAFPGVSQETDSLSTRVLYGYILEKSNYEPIPGGASLSLRAGDGEIQTYQKLSNKYDGSFRLSDVDEKFETLIVSHEGYKDLEINITNINGRIPDSDLYLTRIIKLKLSNAIPENVLIERTSGFTEYDSLVINSDEQVIEIILEEKVGDSPEDYLTFSSEIYQPQKVLIGPEFQKNNSAERVNYKLSVKLEKVQKLFSERGLSTAGKRNQSIGEIPASVVIINKEEIEAQGYQSVSEILESVTGLYLFRDYSWSGGDPIVGMRGFFSQGFNNDLIILVNGVNQYQDYWGFYPFARFPIAVEAIDRIEIVRGPMSVLYGSGAFFGAINIITNSTPEAELRDDEAFPKHVAVSYGSLDTRKVSGGLKYYKDRVSLSFNTNIQQSEGLDQPFSRFLGNNLSTDARTTGMLPWEQRYVGASLNLHDKEGLTQVSVDITSSSEDRGIFESTAASSNTFCQCPIPQANPDAEASINRTTSTYGGLQVSHSPRDKDLNLNMALFFHDFRTEIDYSAGGNRYGQSSFLSKAFEMEISASNSWKNGLSGIVGFNARVADDLFTSFDLPGATFLDGNNYRRLDGSTDLAFLSGFAEFAYQINTKLAITSGIRFEKLSNFRYLSNPSTDTLNNLALPPDPSSFINPGAVVIPRSALVWNLNSTNYLKFLYGEARKRPSFGNFTDNDALTFPVIRTFELNFIRENLPREKANGKKGLRTLLNASIYLNEINGLISRISTVRGGQSVFISSNARDVETLGGEVGLIIQKDQQWSMEFSGSLNSSNETQKLSDDISIRNVDPSYAPLFLGYFKGNYNWNLDKVAITTGFNMRYISEVSPEFELDREDNPVRIGNEVPGYLLSNFNLRISKAQNTNGAIEKSEHFLDNFYVAFNISNIGDAKIQYPTTGNNSSWARNGSPGFGRRFFLTIGFDI